ncbi:MAG: glycosyltransferase family 2 protein [Aquabacterium sp.]|uniref:glycosyltransferase family 2 protein n=1 Tax=Aquabacterium sp. TaxID=1872578 RepID=UPI0025BEE6EA|nr:glycosyltransferase family 2 protein [Aquabacterium sp.]MBI3382960.1 glycosyltransferase family 2 protein [Aquabacterium sp.]
MREPLAISVLILTKNEQQDLPGCLHSVAWSDDVHVYDSGSTDETVSIAQVHGARVTTRSYPDSAAPFGGDEAAHRNWGLRHIPFKHEWVLMLDADERATPALIAAMTSMLKQPVHCAAWRIHRRDYFLGTWIRHVTPSPFNIRLIKPATVRYERIINPVTIVDGPVGEMDAHFDHFPFSKGLSHWFAKHNGYSTFEAVHIVDGGRGGGEFKLGQALFARDANVRRMHQKALYYRLPLRPLVMFLGLYIGKRGFLDGRAGLVYATLRAIYEYMIVLKVTEMQADLQQGGKP